MQTQMLLVFTIITEAIAKADPFSHNYCIHSGLKKFHY